MSVQGVKSVTEMWLLAKGLLDFAIESGTHPPLIVFLLPQTSFHCFISSSSTYLHHHLIASAQNIHVISFFFSHLSLPEICSSCSLHWSLVHANNKGCEGWKTIQTSHKYLLKRCTYMSHHHPLKGMTTQRQCDSQSKLAMSNRWHLLKGTQLFPVYQS